MDIQDLFVLALIAFGVFSSLLGGKKKKSSTAARKRPPPPVARESSAASSRPRGQVEPGRRDAASHMERILRELGLEVPDTEQPASTDRPALEETSEPPTTRPLPRPPVPRELPRVVSLERAPREPVSLEQLDISSEERHDRFHERYLPDKPVARPAGPARRRPVMEYLKPSNLRQAILLKEILGPPKGLE